MFFAPQYHFDCIIYLGARIGMLLLWNTAYNIQMCEENELRTTRKVTQRAHRQKYEITEAILSCFFQTIQLHHIITF